MQKGNGDLAIQLLGPENMWVLEKECDIDWDQLRTLLDACTGIIWCKCDV